MEIREEQTPERLLLIVSLVTYQPDMPVLCATLDSLRTAVEKLQKEVGAGEYVALELVHNGGDLNESAVRIAAGPSISVKVRYSDSNIGFAAGHNLTLNSPAQFHLVLNPDVLQAPDALVAALRWMQAHPEAVLLSPEVCDATGNRSYLCRRKPGLFVLCLRAFAPMWLQGCFRGALENYEMRDCIDGETVYWDPLLVSGCYMFFRAPALYSLGGFDSRYFLYFEDYDISMRIAKLGRIAYVPAVKIIHLGGGAARKGMHHIGLFTRSALRFFRSYGWSV